MVRARIELLTEKKLIGQRLVMTFSNNRTGELWRTFMPRRGEVQNNVNSDLISMQVYPAFFDFDVHEEFEKWAAVEVSDFKTIPDGMEAYILQGGLYAVFHYKGLSTDNRVFQYIFGTWIPNSAYDVDNRPHFEILGANYRNNDPESEEELWVPIKEKIVSTC